VRANECALRHRAAQLLRVSRRPAASRREERVRTNAPIVTLTCAKRYESRPASVAVGAPTSGAAGVRGPRRAQRSEHAGPCYDVQRRGIKSAAQLLRVSRRPAASRRKEQVRTNAPIVTLTCAKRYESRPASAAVGAPTSGASRRRAGPRRAQRSEHAGPCYDVQRRGSPNDRWESQIAGRGFATMPTRLRPRASSTGKVG